MGVLLEVELAALPGHGGKDGPAGGGEAGVVIADEELEASQAALLEALEEFAPMDFGFAEGDARAEDLAFAIGGEAVGAFVIEELQHGLEELRMSEVGHVWFGCWCF